MLLELAVLRMLLQHIGAEGQYAHKPGLLKAVYLAPARALVQARIGISTPCRMRAAPCLHSHMGSPYCSIVCLQPQLLAVLLSNTMAACRVLVGAGEGQGLGPPLLFTGHHLRRAHRFLCPSVNYSPDSNHTLPPHLSAPCRCTVVISCRRFLLAQRIKAPSLTAVQSSLSHPSASRTTCRTALSQRLTMLLNCFPPTAAAGDTGQEGLEALDAADIICATPEKFDSATRSGMRFFADIGLMLIGEERRGCAAADRAPGHCCCACVMRATLSHGRAGVVCLLSAWQVWAGLRPHSAGLTLLCYAR